MKTLFTRFFLAITLLLSSTEVFAQQIVLNVDVAGTLSSKIAESDKYNITDLKLTGEINSTDILYIREMAGIDSLTNITGGKLINLDISQVKIIVGGISYRKDKDGNRYYIKEDNTIGDGMFANTKLQSLIIPSSITSIGNYAFVRCEELSTINLPKSITSIGYSAFSGCKKMLSLTIPDSVTAIRSDQFFLCTGLRAVSIPNSVKIIDNNAFYLCSSLQAISIPDGVEKIEMGTFFGCSELCSISIPHSVTGIGGILS